LPVTSYIDKSELRAGAVGRVVFDSLAAMVMATREGHRFPAYARSLMSIIRDARASVLITSETTTLGPELEATGGLSFLFRVAALALDSLDRQVVAPHVSSPPINTRA